jgi:hypothetical protein
MPVRRSLVATLFLGVPLFFNACRVATDLGLPCQLVKKNPDGGTTSVPILESDLPGGNKDFISFGATECEDLVCVRDANVPRTGVPGAAAMGYCSRACVPNVSGACPAANKSDDSNPDKRLTCRALLLDEATLGAICTNDPSTCQKLGDTRSPYFCARGVDAGM